jgi:tight adherence protein B
MDARTMRWVAAAAATATLSLGSGVAWAAPEGRIQQVESADGAVTYVLSADGLAEGESIDPASVRTTLAGIDAPTTAAAVTAEAGPVIARTTMIVLDSSGSMAEFGKLASAQAAAKQYLATLPADVKAGLVTFADEASVEVAPTEDRAAVTAAIDGLTAEGATALNDAVALTVDELGAEGTRNALLLSDGEDEGSETSAKAARKALRTSGVVLDAVSLGTGKQTAELAAFATAGNGSVVTATDAGELTAAFETAARSVVTQLSVTAQVPEGVEPGTSELVTTALVGDVPITDSAVAVITSVAGPTASASADPYGPIQVASTQPAVFEQPWFLPVVLVLMFGALVAIVAMAIGALDTKNRQQGRVKRRLEEVSVVGAPAAPTTVQIESKLGDSQATRKLVSFADKVADKRDTTALSRKLESAYVPLRPGEWAVVHGLIAIAAALVATLLSDFNILVTLLALVAGLLGPWLYLSWRADKRRKDFYQAIPDGMQMLAGSLSAGYSLPQGLDLLAKENRGPLGQEISRALLESRLGLPLEETLEAAAQRMDSQDFHWVVLAIRTHSQVGGNLAEVLTNVAATLRERERLRRQVRSLTAEGRISTWIVAIIPIFLLLWFILTRRDYIGLLLFQPIGWVILAVGAIFYVIGILWVRKLVNMEV